MSRIYEISPSLVGEEPKLVTCFITANQGLFLFLLETASSRWVTPAGVADEKEAPEKATLRLLKEEVGLRVEEKRLEPGKVLYVTDNRRGAGIVLCTYRLVYPYAPQLVFGDSYKGFV